VVNFTRVRAHIFISGRVQGVFFRSETRYEARRLGVVGWVRNMPDGKVEAVFEGEEKSVKEIIKFCKRGPPRARVTDVYVVWEDYTGEFRDFEIIYGYRF
jgi:acylphosphatase